MQAHGPTEGFQPGAGLMRIGWPLVAAALTDVRQANWKRVDSRLPLNSPKFGGKHRT